MQSALKDEQISIKHMPKLSLDQVFDVQGWGHPGKIRSSGFDNVYKNSGRLTAAWYQQRREQGCYMSFFGSQKSPSMGCFSCDGTLVETIHSFCDIKNVHEDALFYVGDGSWGTVVLAPKLLDSGAKHFVRENCIAQPSAEVVHSWLRKNGTADYWKIVREHVTTRRIFFYWLDRTQHLMEAGGVRQQTDLAEFHAEFVGKVERL
eukprot:CAMPEP_0119337138 /NCGR_PEP_ID=MMETSP1333-20130426/93327_1 /TAXON_ID=418940 /ORGANISM="Scyphosphaera apsteinii, Strain RCC1455" /LENGTH=204 /DNA_ID=CAMNT_0007348113 /DNA_START=82 /DNA_END=696 /DNA_ORIENTATION=+